MGHLHVITHKNPKIRTMWNKHAANELGCLFQALGKDDDGRQRVEVTDAFFFTSRAKVPNRKVKDVNYARIACTIREINKDKCRTRMIVGGNKIKHEGDVDTPTAHL